MAHCTAPYRPGHTELPSAEAVSANHFTRHDPSNDEVRDQRGFLGCASRQRMQLHLLTAADATVDSASGITVPVFPRLALACAVAACLASAADAQLGGYTNSTYAKSLSLKLAKTQLLTIQSPPQVCALPVSDESMGSVFARLKEDASTLSAVMSLRTGGTYPIPITDLEGPVPWLLGTWFPNQGNVTFSYVAVKLDSHTVQMSDRTAVALAAMTAINATCVLDAIVVDTNVSSLFRLSSPIAAYGYQVVTPRPHLHEQTTLQQIWLWTQCVLLHHHSHSQSLRRRQLC